MSSDAGLLEPGAVAVWAHGRARCRCPVAGWPLPAGAAPRRCLDCCPAWPVVGGDEWSAEPPSTESLSVVADAETPTTRVCAWLRPERERLTLESGVWSGSVDAICRAWSGGPWPFARVWCAC